MFTVIHLLVQVLQVELFKTWILCSLKDMRMWPLKSHLKILTLPVRKNFLSKRIIYMFSVLLLFYIKNSNEYLCIFQVTRARLYKWFCPHFCLSSNIFLYTFPKPLKADFLIRSMRLTYSCVRIHRNFPSFGLINKVFDFQCMRILNNGLIITSKINLLKFYQIYFWH